MQAPAPSTMMHLAGRSDRRGLAQLGIHLALLLGSGALVTWAEGIWLVPAVVLLGLVQAALFAPFHETMHQTAFANRRLNAVVGWLAGLPSLFNWHFYQQFHLAHHRHTQDPAKDPELLAAPIPQDFKGYLKRMLGVGYWASRARFMRDALRGDFSAYPYIHPAAAPRVVRSMRAQLAVTVALLLLVGLVFGGRALLLFWVLPQLIGQAALRLYLFTEHTGCSEDRNGLTNTRTMLTTRAMRLLMWNMPFHAEHHLYPFIPFHRLGEAHAVLRDRLAHVHPGYASWHAGHLKGMRA
ncbi:fatty acid desaturase [Paeniroseomonas aquatica]|uniref:Fatty acid desaturase n=2 Tax=Paeniroseomonas aquatica TaxID=373043 RepID=A0ABT8AAE2_9PROT|nr:fatty acid desaturase [Paeniroseomonas aquatica]MDN3566783.1 fatty acid desaturase [Paeniroseomonas aquatica]